MALSHGDLKVDEISSMSPADIVALLITPPEAYGAFLQRHLFQDTTQPETGESDPNLLVRNFKNFKLLYLWLARLLLLMARGITSRMAHENNETSPSGTKHSADIGAAYNALPFASLLTASTKEK